MNDNTYNGWTNYPTWRINLEYGFCDGAYEGYDAEDLQSHVEEHLECSCDNITTLSYALAFVSDVNWHEIAKHIEEEVA